MTHSRRGGSPCRSNVLGGVRPARASNCWKVGARRRAGSTGTAFVQALYQSTLGRPADAAGLAFFAQVLGLGLKEELIAQVLVASDEYFNA